MRLLVLTGSLVVVLASNSCATHPLDSATMDEPTYRTQGKVEPLFSIATNEDWSFFEGNVSHSLPDSYRRFLLQHNGMYIPGGVRFKSPSHVFELTYIYGISRKDERGNILRELSAYAFDKRVPARFLPIGDCQSFERLVISVDGSDKGQIYYWKPPDAWEAKEVVTEEHLIKIADSFPDFWNHLDWEGRTD